LFSPQKPYISRQDAKNAKEINNKYKPDHTTVTAVRCGRSFLLLIIILVFLGGLGVLGGSFRFCF
jgi:hypothetical protein